MDFAKGDRVRSHPSGPVLFVEGVYSNRRMMCSWMDEMGQRHEGAVLRETLRKVAPLALGSSERKPLALADWELSGRRNGPFTRLRPAPLSSALGSKWRDFVARVVRSPA